MTSQSHKLIVLGVIVFLIIFAVVVFMNRADEEVQLPVVEEVVEEVIEETPFPKIIQIGTSVEGRKIEAYSFGDGDTHLLFVGGMHGGYEE